MQDIRQETLNECTRAEQSASVVLWEIDLTEVGGERYFFCNEQNEKGEPVTWQGRRYQPYPIQGSGFELNDGHRDGGRSAESGRRNGGPA